MNYSFKDSISKLVHILMFWINMDFGKGALLNSLQSSFSNEKLMALQKFQLPVSKLCLFRSPKFWHLVNRNVIKVWWIELKYSCMDSLKAFLWVQAQIISQRVKAERTNCRRRTLSFACQTGT